MPRAPLATLFQLYGAPRPFWAAAAKGLRLVRTSGIASLVKATRQKLAHPTLPIDVAGTNVSDHLAFEERWVIRGAGLTRLYPTTVIILTRGTQPLVNACLTSLVRSMLPDARLEVLVVNNGGRIALPLAFPFPLRLLRETRPFNWAAYNNRAAEHATGEFLLFLNDDIEALHGGWLDAMLAEAILPSVGAVGPKLLYPDGMIQHYGVVVDARGSVRLAHRFRPRDDPDDPDHQYSRPHPVTAVTGACLLTAKETFQHLHFDDRFALSYNDVDYCLRLRKAEKQVVVTPYAELIHRETATRQLSVSKREQQLFRQKWETGG